MASSDGDMVRVWVSRRVLHIGEETAYPLPGIVRVSWPYLKIRIWPLIWAILWKLVAFLIAWSLAARYGSGLINLIKLLLVAVFLVWISGNIRALWQARHTYYTLTLVTAGGLEVSTTLVSTDGEQMRKIAYQILVAIDDPAFQGIIGDINNIHVGDNIIQNGNWNIGKVLR
jgi:hypothetical protein